MKSKLFGKKAFISVLSVLILILCFGFAYNLIFIKPNLKPYELYRQKSDEGYIYLILQTDKNIEDKYIQITSYNGDQLSYYKIPESIKNIPVEKVGHGAFTKCQSAEVFDVPKTMKYLDDDLFVYCRSLKKLIIRSDDIKLGNNLFAQNNNITIVAHKGSTAEKYALDNNIKFEELK